jgi:hypothetical protein
MRQIEVSVDVFAAIWAARRPDEASEDEVLARVLGVRTQALADQPHSNDAAIANLPRSKKWTDVLVWTLRSHGGKASLAEIYKTSRVGRRGLGYATTAEHEASARECLESHCSDSEKFRGKADLFWMPEGKGAGVWALRE